MCIRDSYHSLYTRAAAGAIELLEKQERTAEAVALCRRAIHIEPYQEDLYEHLMRGLLRTGDMKGAMSVSYTHLDVYKRQGYDRFTSTLFVSPYQNHELMRQICEQMAEKYGVEYLHLSLIHISI